MIDGQFNLATAQKLSDEERAKTISSLNFLPPYT
ncbi:MAG: hypothetical protein Ct9H90mP19_0290 [Gammaproteobacteria bacterium]|nr:MAG: hypothetical protein Ct9H90mP19_0290 [Gammaproteobacteria bacterium]